MRCHEAKRRLARLFAEGREISSDPALAAHLERCAACASLVRAEQALQRDLGTLAEPDNADAAPLPQLRTRVEARVRAQQAARTEEKSFMSKITSNLKRRPRLGLSLGVAAVALLVATVIPFSFNDTIGYEVALAGVDPDLALDEFRLQELLTGLGLENATFEVSDCTATCKLKVGDLKSEQDVKIVVTAFDELGNCALEDVQEFVGKVSTTLAGRLKARVTAPEEISEDNVIVEIVTARLDSMAADGDFDIWITKTGSDDAEISATLIELDSAMALGFGDMDEIPDHILVSRSGGKIGTVYGNLSMITEGNSGEVSEISFDDPDAVERLRAAGYEVRELEDGALYLRKTYETDSTVDEDELRVAPKTQSTLPEGFELGQNYPNPFNPNTRIDLTLPSAQHVRVEIININGQVVTTLLDEDMGPGPHTVTWNATDSGGRRVASGVYFYHLQAGEFSATKKMTLLK